MGWLLKLVCALVLAGMMGLCLLSGLSMAAAIVLPSLAPDQVFVSSAMPLLPEGRVGMAYHTGPLGLAAGHAGVLRSVFAAGLGILAITVFAAILLGWLLFGRRRERHFAADGGEIELMQSLHQQSGRLAARLESLETLLLDRGRTR
ncbi:MAG: hypothetical protein HYV27_12255 [Candidatus Hydrogenedentes bacterium]|nr:hypothetical protein [Candidatus Hydrogenedentota bacterium]